METATEMRRIVDAGQADAQAEMRRNLASLDKTLARRNRIALAHERSTTRLSRMCEARHITRTEELRTCFEFLGHLQNMVSATPEKTPDSMLARYRGWALKLACAIEDDMTSDEVTPEPSFDGGA